METERDAQAKCLPSEIDSDHKQAEIPFPVFIIRESREEVQLTKLSPFLTQKVISSTINLKSVKTLKSSIILKKISNKKTKNMPSHYERLKKNP